MIERLEAIVLRLQPRRIVELGVATGGSTAFLATLATTRTSDRDRTQRRTRARSSTRSRASTCPTEPTRPIAQPSEAAVGDEPLDLVVDDASHLLDLTRTSFNILFPRLRPGGVYMIEDWAWAHADYGGATEGRRLVAEGESLTRLVVELLMTCGSSNGIVANLYATPGTVEIVRGPAPLDETFDIARSFRSGITSTITHPE